MTSGTTQTVAANILAHYRPIGIAAVAAAAMLVSKAARDAE